MPADAREIASRVPSAPFLERCGVSFFRRREPDMGRPAPLDAVHVLNTEERAALRRVERGAITRWALAGSLSATISAFAQLHLSTSAFLSVTVVAAAIEMAFLYWDALRSVHRLARVAGLELFPGNQERSAVAVALARAALELPNPPESLLGVNPLRSASRLALALASLLYKVKIGLTNFLLRALLRRLLGRTAVRALLVFVSVPVTALWNALVCWLILREARIRVMGPSAAGEALGNLLADAPLSWAALSAALRAVASTVVRKRDMHPNLAVVLELVHRQAGRPALEAVDDEALFLRDLSRLPSPEQETIIRVLQIALVIDGRLTRRERGLWRAARQVCGLPPDEAGIRALRRAFVRGDPLIVRT